MMWMIDYTKELPSYHTVPLLYFRAKGRCEKTITLLVDTKRENQVETLERYFKDSSKCICRSYLIGDSRCNFGVGRNTAPSHVSIWRRKPTPPSVQAHETFVILPLENEPRRLPATFQNSPYGEQTINDSTEAHARRLFQPFSTVNSRSH